MYVEEEQHGVFLFDKSFSKFSPRVYSSLKRLSVSFLITNIYLNSPFLSSNTKPLRTNKKVSSRVSTKIVPSSPFSKYDLSPVIVFLLVSCTAQVTTR